MTISVAMCTYNGAKFIEKQVLSIIEQTVPVDEIVICDDGSLDGTIDIVMEIQSEVEIPIRLYINEPNIGVCANFDKAIKLCKGDIIFLSDQDDVWMPDKVETIVSWFKANPSKNVVFTNASFIDSDGNPYETDSSLFKAVGFTSTAKEWFDRGFSLELFLKNNRATGATMALRLPFVKHLYIDSSATSFNGKPLHDYLISLCAIEHKS